MEQHLSFYGEKREELKRPDAADVSVDTHKICPFTSERDFNIQRRCERIRMRAVAQMTSEVANGIMLRLLNLNHTTRGKDTSRIHHFLHF